MNKLTELFLAFFLVIFCVACGKTEGARESDAETSPAESEASAAPAVQDIQQDDLSTADVGEMFYTGSPFIEGKLSCTINSFRWSDNTKDLGVDPGDLLDFGNQPYIFWDNGETQSVDQPVNMTTGQLSEHLIIVVAELTVINEDATCMLATGAEDSQYVFPVNFFKICDRGSVDDSGSGYSSFSCLWYTGTEDYDASAMGTNGSNYFVLHPGETKTVQIGFIIGDIDDEFGQLYLTDGDDSFDSQFNYVYLNIPEQKKG